MSRTSPYKRALAARMIREGKSYTEAGRAIDRDRRTITRWMRDESFLNMLHAHGVLTAGPLRVRAAVDDVLQDLPTEESWLWLSVPDATVLGSLVVDDATCSVEGRNSSAYSKLAAPLSLRTPVAAKSRVEPIVQSTFGPCHPRATPC